MHSETSEKFVTNLDWNLLRTFVVIVEEGGITSAAIRLLRRQPTISLALARLEKQIGARLIERGGGAFEMTAAGRELYRECADIYGGISRLQEVMDKASHEFTGHIDLLLASHVETNLLDETLGAFSRRHPRVTFNIEVATSAIVTRRVLEKTASLGICLLNERLPQLEYQILYREFFGFFCGSNHPLFGKKNLRLNDLRGFSAVSFGTDDMADALRPVSILRQQHGLDHNIIGRSAYLEEVRRMVLCGLGIGPLPIHVARRDLEAGLLWRLPPYKAPPPVDIHLVTNPGKRLNRAETGFIDALREKIRSLPLKDRTCAS